MTILSTDVDLFSEVAKLPSEVITIIVDHLPKCILPELLHFPPIRREIASTILSDVYITENVQRHKGSDELLVGHSLCDCNHFKIKLIKLKQGITQWNIYPKTIHLERIEQFTNVSNNFPELLTEALSINGIFFGKEVLESNELTKFLENSNIKFDMIILNDFQDLVKIPPVATTILLFDTLLDNYNIPDVKKIDIEMKSRSMDSEFYDFPIDMDELQIKGEMLFQATLIPNLRKLCITAEYQIISYRLEELTMLEYLLLNSLGFTSFYALEMNVPNLKTLILTECEGLSEYDGLEDCQHLKHLTINDCAYPFEIFNETRFLELESFEYSGSGYINPKYFEKENLTFPPNLKQLSIKTSDFINVRSSQIVFPTSLIRLELLDVSFIDQYFHLDDNLQYIHIETPKLLFDNKFNIPSMTEELILKADYLIFESPNFMYSLPKNLLRLHLIADKQGKMSSFIQTIKWPLIVSDFAIKGFNIDYKTLKLLNLKESRLREINVCQGNVKVLNTDLFPISVEYFTLLHMGIHKLPASLEELKNLQKLSLSGNQFRKINSVKLPISPLIDIDLSQCNLGLVSPFLVSMFEEKNRNPKLRVNATGNLNINISDIKRALKIIKGLSLELNKFNEALTEISKHSSRLHCISQLVDPYFEESTTEKIVGSDYDPEDLYNGSDFNLDEEEIDYVIAPVTEDESEEESEEDIEEDN